MIDTDTVLSVSFIIPGSLQQEAKHHVRRGKWQRRVDVREAAEWKVRAAAWALQAMQEARLKPFDEPLVLEATWYRPKPRSWRKHDNLPHVKPDLSNYEKLLEDALTGIVYRDDSLIVDKYTHKRFGVPERVEVLVRAAVPDYPYRRN